MTNMSYCRFENTYHDLKDCVDAMMEAESIDDLDMNKIDTDYFHDMVRMCERYINIYHDLNDRAQLEEEVDEYLDSNPTFGEV